MSGTNRIVQPRVRFNPGFGTVADGGLYTSTGAATFTAATATLGFKRYGYYQPVGPEDTPLQFDWQYTRETTRISINGVSKATIPMPLAGQILLIFVRLFDRSREWRRWSADLVDQRQVLSLALWLWPTAIR